MLQKTCDDQLRQRLVFVGANRAQVTRCLELISYDSIEDEPGIVIPLPDAMAGAGARALPGAPMAFLHPDRYAIIDDTLQIEFATAIPQDIRAEIRAYLEQKTFRSFGSIQVPGSAGILGVINLEARVPQVFGRTDDEKRKVISYLLPFCAALAIVFPNP